MLYIKDRRLMAVHYWKQNKNRDEGLRILDASGKGGRVNRNYLTKIQETENMEGG